MPGNAVGCCLGPGGSDCDLTIHLEDCEGNPIGGATVSTFLQFNPTPVATGTTDGGGNYTFTDSGGSYFIVTWDGAYYLAWFGSPAMLAYNCVDPICLRYDRAIVTVTTPAAAGATVSAGCLPWTSIATPSAGTTIFTYKVIRPCLYPSPFPAACTFTASVDNTETCDFTPAGYLSECQDLTVHCDDEVTLDIPMFEYGPCYHFGQVGVNNACVDDGCDSFGPDRRNLLPRTIQVRLTTVENPINPFLPGLGDAPLFADDEAQWITLTLSVAGRDALCRPTGYLYDSGCRGPQGNFVGGPIAFYFDNPDPTPCYPTYPAPYASGLLNHADAYAASYPYASTRVTWYFGSGPLPFGVPQLGLAYTRYTTGDCSGPLGCQPWLDLDSELCRGCTTGVVAPIPCSIADSSGVSAVAGTPICFGGTALVEVREVAC